MPLSKADEEKAALINKIFCLFAEHGFDGVSMDEGAIGFSLELNRFPYILIPAFYVWAVLIRPFRPEISWGKRKETRWIYDIHWNHCSIDHTNRIVCQCWKNDLPLAEACLQKY